MPITYIFECDRCGERHVEDQHGRGAEKWAVLNWSWGARHSMLLCPKCVDGFDIEVGPQPTAANGE